ncbi:MAG: MtrB/PioB family decaheme-associated outer membrane protein [Betaproteobacteria bacterium]|nr:MtrB/PioB family decaheme-associated outer membrane protein [Betaproteobacteria bacterium]
MIQNKTAPLRRNRIGFAVCSALATLAVAPAYADPVLTARLFRDTDVLFRDADMSRWADNYVELGVGYNSKDSFRFGQFSGLIDKGGFPLAGFNWLTRDVNNDAQYWHVYGSTLGLDSRKLQAEGGIQGKWNVSLSLDQIKKSQTESASFIHDGLGTSNLTLPAAYKAKTAADTAAINPRLRQFGIQQGRDIIRLGLNGIATSDWDWKVSYREDHRDGTRIAGVRSALGGQASALVPYQIDDRTRRVNTILSYTTKVAQFSLGYNYSQYHNNLASFNVRNPFTNTVGETDARMSLAPSNDFHQINATGGYNLTKSTRLTSKFSYSIARQNESFLPYSANLATGAAGNVAPRASLDGKVVKTLLDIALTAKPMDKMNLKLAYQYHQSDNQTPAANYDYLGHDGIAKAGGTRAGEEKRRNTPLSTTENKLAIDGDYEIAARTILRAGLERKNVNYSTKDALYKDMADRNLTNTDKLSVELRRPISDEFLGSVGYIYTQRRGSEYDRNVEFRNSYWDPTFLAARPLNEHPSLRPFMYSDYNEDRVRASGNWTASETVSLQTAVDTYRQKSKGPNCNSIADASAITANGIPAATAATLPDSCLGRTLADGANVNLDVQWQPEENLTTFAFASYGMTGTRQAGRSWTRSTTTASNQTRDWFVDLENRDNTVGFGLKWQPKERWDLGGTYVLNKGVGKASVSTGTGIPAQTSMPDSWNQLHSLQLFAKWDYSKELSWRFNYLYENLRSADWAYDNVAPTATTQVLLTGQTAPRYSNHVFGVSAVVKSW